MIHIIIYTYINNNSLFTFTFGSKEEKNPNTT